MSKIVFSNIIEFIYAIYDYKASKNEKIFELEHLRAEIIENGYRGNKREVIPKIEYLIKELNKRR